MMNLMVSFNLFCWFLGAGALAVGAVLLVGILGYPDKLGVKEDKIARITMAILAFVIISCGITMLSNSYSYLQRANTLSQGIAVEPNDTSGPGRFVGERGKVNNHLADYDFSGAIYVLKAVISNNNIKITTNVVFLIVLVIFLIPAMRVMRGWLMDGAEVNIRTLLVVPAAAVFAFGIPSGIFLALDISERVTENQKLERIVTWLEEPNYPALQQVGLIGGFPVGEDGATIYIDGRPLLGLGGVYEPTPFYPSNVSILEDCERITMERIEKVDEELTLESLNYPHQLPNLVTK